MVNINKIVLSLTLLLTLSTWSQEKRIAKGDKSFSEYSFVEARNIYLEVVEKGYESADLYRKIADSYYFNAEMSKAVTWYEKLNNKFKDEVDPEYLFRYSQCLKNVGRYDESDKIMEQFNALSSTDQRAEYFASTRDYLNFIEIQSGKFEIESLDINSKYSDYAPSFKGETKLVFASAKPPKVTMQKVIHEWNELYFLDLYASEIGEDGKALSTPQKIKGKVNSMFHESSTTFTKDGLTMYFTRNNFTDKRLKSDSTGTTLLKMYRATFKNNKWRDVEDLPFNSDEYSVAHPSLSADGKQLYFASDMPGSKGLSDLYVVDVNEDGTFGTPKNLGDRINTEGRETFPYITDSGQLYFASDGHVGLGGLDVFVAVPDEEEKDGLSNPYNVGKPINSPDDDFSFVLNEATKIGYFATNRKGGKGQDDIYRFKQLEDLFTECRQYVSGVISDKNTKAPIAEAEVILLDEANQELNRIVTDNKGVYEFQLACEAKYVIRAAKVSYEPKEAMITATDAPEYKQELSLELDKGEVIADTEVKPGEDLAIVLQVNPIYFSFNRYEIRADDEPELQKVIVAMSQNPELKIEVRSHTDSMGDDQYNLYLSEKRAESTVNYIIQKGGIDASRVSGKGYGETELVNECANEVPCSIEKHRMNRRSEFIVIK